MALILRNVLFFAFCTGSLAASIPEGITLISSDGIPITHGGDERLVGIRGNLPQASTGETPELVINAEYSLEQGSGVGDEPVSVVIPVSERFSYSMAVVPDPTAVPIGPYRVVEQAEKSLAAKLHAWLAGLIPKRSTSHVRFPPFHVCVQTLLPRVASWSWSWSNTTFVSFRTASRGLCHLRIFVCFDDDCGV